MAYLLLLGSLSLARLKNSRTLLATVLAVGLCSRALAEGGYLDTTFQPEVEVEVRSMAKQSDGKVLAFATRTNGPVVIGGRFTRILGIPRQHLGQILTNRTGDPDFVPSLNGTVYGIALQQTAKRSLRAASPVPPAWYATGWHD